MGYQSEGVAIDGLKEKGIEFTNYSPELYRSDQLSSSKEIPAHLVLPVTVVESFV